MPQTGSFSISETPSRLFAEPDAIRGGGSASVELGRRATRGEITRYEENGYDPRLPTFAALA
jgi:hypothetical protein